MLKVIKILLLNTVLFGSMSCNSNRVVDLNIKPISKVVGYLNTISINRDGNSEVYTARYVEQELVGFTLLKEEVENTFTFEKDEQGLITGFSDAENATTFSFTANKSLKEIDHPDGLKELLELNSAGKWEYYYKQREQDGATVYEEIRQFTWDTDNVSKLVINKPGSSYEEESFRYGTEDNPFISFKKEWPVLLGFESYLISAKAPESSSRTFAGENMRYAFTLNDEGKLLSYSIEKQTEGSSDFSPYITYEMTYHQF